MIILTTQLVERLEAITKMPRSTYTFEGLLANIQEKQSNPVLFCDLLELQLKMIDAAMAFVEQRIAAEGDGHMLKVLGGIAATVGYAMARASEIAPSPGKDIVKYVHEQCVAKFYESLGHNIAWVPVPADAKTPNYLPETEHTLN